MPRKLSTALFILFLYTRPALALIYLPENTLESLLVKSDAVAIATVASIDEAANRGKLDIADSLKGTAPARLDVTAVTIRVTAVERKARFAAGDRIIVFLAPEAAGTRQILHSQKLENDAEVRTMKGCVAEVMPVAQILTDLADPKKEIAVEPLRKALTPLAASKNAYTQILVGRLMTTRLPGAVKPESWEPLLTTALATKRPELVKGAIAWSAKFEKLPAPIKTLVEKLAKEADDKSVREAAQALLQSR